MLCIHKQQNIIIYHSPNLSYNQIHIYYSSIQTIIDYDTKHRNPYNHVMTNAYDTTDTMHVVPINRGINPPNRSTPHRDTAHRHNFRTMGNMSTNDPNITGIHHQMHMNECTHIPYLKTSPIRCTTSSHHNSPFSSPNKYVHAAQSFNYSHIFTSNISFNHHRHIITTIMIIVATNLSPHQHIVTFKNICTQCYIQSYMSTYNI